MKKATLIFAVTLSMFFTNCKKNTADSPDVTTTTAAGYTITDQNRLNVEGLKSLPDQTSKKIAYGLLQPVEKYLAWLESAKAASVNFTPQQKLLVNDLANFLTPQLFNKTDLGKAASFRDKWLADAKKVFTADQIRAIAFQLFANTDAKSQLAINQEDQAAKTCNCNSGSDYSCSSGYSCPDNYDKGLCKDYTVWYCGFLGLWPCDNLCYPNATQAE